MVFEYYLGSNTLTRIASIRLPNNGRIYEYQTIKNFYSNYSPELTRMEGKERGRGTSFNHKNAVINNVKSRMIDKE